MFEQLIMYLLYNCYALVHALFKRFFLQGVFLSLFACFVHVAKQLKTEKEYVLTFAYFWTVAYYVFVSCLLHINKIADPYHCPCACPSVFSRKYITNLLEQDFQANTTLSSFISTFIDHLIALFLLFFVIYESITPWCLLFLIIIPVKKCFK